MEDDFKQEVRPGKDRSENRSKDQEDMLRGESHGIVATT